MWKCPVTKMSGWENEALTGLLLSGDRALRPCQRSTFSCRVATVSRGSLMSESASLRGVVPSASRTSYERLRSGWAVDPRDPG